ncbi:MAG TPA: adenylate/guanylate cyclase domain-containing protein [Candidatus Binataceae bacterium]|nr:adenylate/guanylate cyclase domain-containing protein [Candidatus Binataceae bacterium]
MSSENRCGKCGSNNPPRSKFCGECGTSLRAYVADHFTLQTNQGQVPPDLDAEPLLASGGERKMVTALFADIKGSLELIRDLDPEDARAIVDPALQLMAGAIHRYDGYVVQSTGDGIFALFGAPIAHEEHPQRALYAAVRMQNDLRRYSDQSRAAGRLPIQVRVGVNTGEVVVRILKTGTSQGEYTPIGHPINIAARMQELAPIGSIGITEQVRSLCEGYFTFKGLGPAKLKGVIEPVPIYEVTGLGPLRTHFQVSERRGLTRFVGRGREIEALKQAADRAQAGSGQVVAARGEPGVGKSRLFYEFKAIVQSGWLVLETFSISHGKASAYMPVVDLLRNYFKITSQDDERSRREKIAGKLVILDRALEELLPYIYSLLGIAEGAEPLAPMDAQIRRWRTLDAIKSIILRESLNQPVVLIFEDLHWIDTETQALLELLVDGVADARVLLLVNYRPEYHHNWQHRTYYTELVLDPLRRQNAKEMLDELLDSSESVTFSAASHLDTSSGFDVAGQIKATDIDELKQIIIERADGNPFFMEEIVHALFEQGVLATDPAVRLTRPLTDVKIPTSVQSVLASRIDRLPVEDKELLQTLAVLGREFPFMLVQRVTGKPAQELEDTLFQLRAADFIYEQPGQNDIELIFKHALTQQVAYNSLLIERRRQIHEQGAQAIESLFASSLQDHYEALARHYSRSGNAAKAVDYLYLAAQQAMSRSAHSEAKTQLSAALELLRIQPDVPEHRRIEVRVLLGLAICTRVSTSGGLFATEPISMLDRARKLSAEVGDDILAVRGSRGSRASIWQSA